MAIWAIGDIQGCYKSFIKLLEKIEFDSKKDRLWIAGDLVNRGSGSLEVLEYLYNIKDSVDIILGNHDITLIAVYYGLKKSNPTIDPIIQSPNASKLISWLRGQKLLHIDYDLGYCMSHAGISPEFDLGMAINYAKRVEDKLQSEDVKEWLKQMLKEGVNHFDRKSKSIDIDYYILSSFTRMRFCYKDYRLDYEQKGKPTNKLRDKGLKPWFECENRKDIDLSIIFGHWSTLGLYDKNNIIGLDTGCLWGGTLTACRIDNKKREFISIECAS